MQGHRTIWEGLFHAMGESVAVNLGIGAAVVSRADLRSYHAHVRKLGMSSLRQFAYDGEMFWTLALDLKGPSDGPQRLSNHFSLRRKL